MNLTINGEQRVLSAQTLSTLVEELGMKLDRVAIELNREIVHKEQWTHTRLKDGDRLEIVHFVGGGSIEPGRCGSPWHLQLLCARLMVFGGGRYKLIRSG